MAKLSVSRTKKCSEGAGFVSFGGFIHFCQIFALLKNSHEFLRLGRDGFKGLSFEEYDSPGENRKEKEYKEDKFDDDISFKDKS